MAKPSNFDTNVFINCPFDDTYRPILCKAVDLDDAHLDSNDLLYFIGRWVVLNV